MSLLTKHVKLTICGIHIGMRFIHVKALNMHTLKWMTIISDLRQFNYSNKHFSLI